MSAIKPTWKQPSHPDLLKIVSQPGNFASLSLSQVELPPGSLLVSLGMPPITQSPKAYSTVQVSASQHIELNCDFLFINHSCEPSLEFVIMNMDNHHHRNGTEMHYRDGNAYSIDIRVAARKDSNGNKIGLRKGDELTFFYPSTEWEMSQPFECTCTAKGCRGRISGAKDMGPSQLRGYFLNDHILELMKVN